MRFAMSAQPLCRTEGIVCEEPNRLTREGWLRTLECSIARRRRVLQQCTLSAECFLLTSSSLQTALRRSLRPAYQVAVGSRPSIPTYRQVSCPKMVRLCTCECTPICLRFHSLLACCSAPDWRTTFLGIPILFYLHIRLL